MRFHVVYWNERFVQHETKPGRDARTGQQRTAQPWSHRHCNGIDFIL
jgi:hypothetical protein